MWSLLLLLIRCQFYCWDNLYYKKWHENQGEEGLAQQPMYGPIFCSSSQLHNHFILLQTPCQSTFHGKELGMSQNGWVQFGRDHRKLQEVLLQNERFFLHLPSCAQLLRIHFPEILQMKVLQTLMIDLLALLGFAGLLTVLLIFLTSLLGGH